MDKRMLVASLIDCANRIDKKGLTKDAEAITRIAEKIVESGWDSPVFEVDQDNIKKEILQGDTILNTLENDPEFYAAIFDMFQDVLRKMVVEYTIKQEELEIADPAQAQQRLEELQDNWADELDKEQWAFEMARLAKAAMMDFSSPLWDITAIQAIFQSEYEKAASTMENAEDGDVDLSSQLQGIFTNNGIPNYYN